MFVVDIVETQFIFTDVKINTTNGTNGKMMRRGMINHNHHSHQYQKSRIMLVDVDDVDDMFKIVALFHTKKKKI